MTTQQLLPFGAAVAVLGTVVLLDPAEAQVPPAQTRQSEIDPKADRVLRQMVDFAKNLKSASVEITTEYEGKWGPHGPSLISKVMTFSVAVQRPNRYAVRLEKGKSPLRWIVTDGVKTAGYNQYFGGYWVEDRDLERSSHSRVFLRSGKGAAALGEGFLVNKDLYDSILKPLKGGQYVGLEKMDQREYHHLKFSEEKGASPAGMDMTWGLWIQSGPEPLVYKVVIVPAETRQKHTEPPIIFETLEKVTKTFSNWKVNPDLPKETFAIPHHPG